jgi:amino acid transporter
MPDGTTPRFTEESLAPFSFTEAFALFFPSVTGIMAGSNRSGDLANAQSSIPRGTIAAVLVTSALYLVSALLFGAVAERDALKADPLLSTTISLNDWLVRVGIVLSSLGAGLQSLTGAPRLLQAIANDNLMPALKFFQGSGEPRRPLIATFMISFGCIMLGNINAVAPLITMFFLLCYTAVNAAVLVQDILQACVARRSSATAPVLPRDHPSSRFAGAELAAAIPRVPPADGVRGAVALPLHHVRLRVWAVLHHADRRDHPRRLPLQVH